MFGIIYFVGGVLFMHFARGVSGSEMIPNVTFWKAVPGLVKARTHTLRKVLFSCMSENMDLPFTMVLYEKFLKTQNLHLDLFNK